MDTLITILIEKYGMTEIAAKRNAKKLSKYEDIMNEFLSVSTSEEKDNEKNEDNDEGNDNKLVIEGYSAKDIQSMTDILNTVGIYNFMVTLRDNPEKAKEIIESDFAVK